MKRYGNLYDQICTLENVQLAMTKAARNKKKKLGVIHTLQRKDEAIAEILEMLKNETYCTSKYHRKEVYEPKRRIIYSLPFFPDRILHHAVLNVLEPIWNNLLDSQCHSCRKDMGTLSGSRSCMAFTRKYRYVLKCDVSKFYPSVDHEICKSIIRKKLKDARLLNLLDEIIDSANRIPDATIGKNAPIGNLLSQWFGNLYMNELDVWLRQECGVHAYVRYCDDFAIFSDSKAFLNGIKAKLPEFLESHLKLHLSKANLFPTSRGVDFLGYRHFPKFILLRKRNARKVKAFAHGVEAGTIPHNAHSQGVASSYHGLLMHSNSYNLRKSLKFDEIYSKYKELPKNADEALQ